MLHGASSLPAFLEAANRLPPTTTSKSRSVTGRTIRGSRTPCTLMLSASSLSESSSMMRRGLVLDGMRTLRGRLRYSVAVVGFMVVLLVRLGVRGHWSERHHAVRL